MGIYSSHQPRSLGLVLSNTSHPTPQCLSGELLKNKNQPNSEFVQFMLRKEDDQKYWEGSPQQAPRCWRLPASPYSWQEVFGFKNKRKRQKEA